MQLKFLILAGAVCMPAALLAQAAPGPDAATQPARDRGRRKRHLLRKCVGGLAIVALDQVQERNVEAIEHRRQAAKFWHEGKRNCTQRARF